MTIIYLRFCVLCPSYYEITFKMGMAPNVFVIGMIEREGYLLLLSKLFYVLSISCKLWVIYGMVGSGL